MSGLNPQKLHVCFAEDLNDTLITSRCYTLTHSDSTGEPYLTVAQAYDKAQISGWYTRLMRDEVLGEWQADEAPSLHLHCHVSGGLVLGSARWRDAIFKSHLALVLAAICYGERAFLRAHPELGTAPIMVHFHAKQNDLARVEGWGTVNDHLVSVE